MRSMLQAIAAASLLTLAPAISLGQQKWGDIKGQVVWAGNALPAPKVVNNRGCPCAKPVIDNDLIVNPKTKGVKNVAVWLVEPTGKALPIHPKLKPIPADPVVIDQPCCLFEPRVTMLRAGQTLEIRNSSAIAHNSLLLGKRNAPKNLLIGPGKKEVFKGNSALVAEERPISVACNIHGWMGARIYVFDHPYFALTDSNGKFEIKNAPAGNYRIYIQHEDAGWLHQPKVRRGNIGGSKGQPITIPAGGVLDMGKIKYQ